MKRNALVVLTLAFFTTAPSTVLADAGVLIPASVKPDPDPAILSLRSMDVTVRIDHLHARVDMKSIFENHTDGQLEGKYVLPLGDHATVEDFSVWQGEERLVGAIVEKQKGRKLFEQLVRRELDPGLAETDDDADKARNFTLRVAPIPAFGTARVEVTFSEDLHITSRGVLFTLPWKPRRYGTQKVGRLHVDVAADGPYALSSVTVKPRGGLRWSTAPTPGGTRFAGSFDGKDVELTEDLTLEMALAPSVTGVDSLAWRDPSPRGRQDLSPFGDGTVYRDDRGYFLVRTIASPPSSASGGAAPAGAPRDVVILLDTSLSMQWEKLERSFAALEYFLGRLGPADRFNVVTFNDEVHAASPDLLPATSASAQKALQFVRGSSLGGGTDLGAGLAAGLALLGKAPRGATSGPEPARTLVLISDGNPTLGEIGYTRIGEAFTKANAGTGRARLFVLGVGDDASTALLGRLASAGDGYFGHVREGSDTAFLLRTFFDKLGQSSLRDVVLAVSSLTGVSQVYPGAQPSVFEGSDATFFGRYATPGQGTVSVRGRAPGQSAPTEVSAPLSLPERDTTRPWVARGWARMRIDDLLDQIAADSEKPEWVREIIALAKEFHFVTPYTSFIAAPRALLRPRVIQPGDPVLRVKVSRDIHEVVAVFPFGLTQALSYLPSEDVWQTRFLAPTWMQDGTYSCLLVLTDSDGKKIRESKSFVIDSKPPTVKATLSRASAAAGDTLGLEVHADADTRRISARIGDGPSSDVVWDPHRHCSVGTLHVPLDSPTGRALVTVVAEDMAHNLASAQLPLDVLSGGR